METLGLAVANLTSPVVLAFVLGMVATAARSDLRLPEPVYAAVTIYLLFAIGLKGGAALSQVPPAEVWRPALAALAVGTLIPLICYPVLRGPGRLSVADSAAICAHYGSVSVVTFTAALAFLDRVGQPYDGIVTALLAMMEMPAIMVALLIARFRGVGAEGHGLAAVREVLAGRSVLLLGGGLIIGLIAGRDGLAQIGAFFEAPFAGVLMIFLLEMGIVAAGRIGDFRKAGVFLVAFAIAMPVFNGAIGVLAGAASGMSLGGATVLGVLAASASYIAAPAAVRIALPQASPGYYLTTALGITFPFNLVVGIPLYYWMASVLYS